VPPAVAACRRAGIDVKIVTGDTPDTAREIGRQVGLLTGSEGPGAEMTGPAFGALSDEDASAATVKLKVLSRARPLDKLRLVRLLTARGEVVAVTGDGTNDAPALNYAAVGLAMGKAGTAVAKEAADVVLLDDSFGSVVTAVRWGRGLYENIQRFILFQLTINVVALGVALLGPFLGVDFPLTVMQMLWVNLIMDTFAALALATEPPTEAVLSRPPRHPEAFIVTGPMARLIFGVGGVFLATMLVMMFALPGLRDEAAADHKWSLTVFFSVFVLLQFWNLFNARTLGTGRSAFVGFFRNPSFVLIAAVILVGQVLLVQFGGEVFRTVPLSATEWAVILVATAPVLVVGEVLRATGKGA
jgi:Ca2+-transporting ATPase